MKINIVFAEPKPDVRFKVKYGTLIAAAQGSDSSRYALELGEVNLAIGAAPTIVTVLCQDSFSFNLRDVDSQYPIYIPQCSAAVLPESDQRSYAAVAKDVADKGLQGDFERMNAEEEESYENACKYNRDKYSPMWLGLGGDFRAFTVSPRLDYYRKHRTNDVRDYQYWGRIRPHYHTYSKPAEPDKPESVYDIAFEVGPGAHCRPKLSYRLDQGVLPILHSVQDEQDVMYNVTAFASLEKQVLQTGKVRGSDWQVAYSKTGHNQLGKDELEKMQQQIREETLEREEELLCIIRIEALNVSKMPTHAWFKVPYAIPAVIPITPNSWREGMSMLGEQVLAISRLNGQRMPAEEMAVMIKPGEKCVFEIIVPHNPLDQERAAELFNLDYQQHLQACRRFWQEKLEKAAKISVPERTIDERIKAGLLHLDIMTLGKYDEGPLLPTVGGYSPIGTESAPMIQYYDSIGLEKTAERCIDFFLERQREDGFIQNFNNYESETGPLLWSAAEHFRYSQNLQWLQRVTPKLRQACDYLLAWRERNKKEEYRERGFYGLVDGKVADPNDFFHSFFLNAGTYAGLSGMAEALQHSIPEYAQTLTAEVELYKHDLVHALEYSLAHSPVKPTADGSWVASAAPWVEYTGCVSFYADGGNWFTHGAFAARSSLVGALYFAITDIFAPKGKVMDSLLKANQHPVTRENAGLSQPYYCRHDLAHLKRGEVKLFLKTFYNQVSALQDRQSYGFWEHYYGASEYKTHEEAWFLMQLRWMLFFEEDNGLTLFKAVPRRWLEPGKKIKLEGVKSYFGKLNAEVEASAKQIVCRYEVERPVSLVRLRLPHPQGIKAVKCLGGLYDSESETVSVEGNKAEVTLQF